MAATSPNPSATSDATQASPAPPPPSDSLPDPFAGDPFEASGSPSSSSLPDPFGADPFQTSPSGGAAPAPGSAGAPQSGVWFNDPDPQYLIQWSLQEVQESQPTAPTASQATPPATCKARVRIYQEVFQTTLAAVRPVVPFSLRDANTGSLCLQGSLVLLQQPSDPPVLLVKNLKFSGFQQAQVVLFPSVPDTPGGASGV